MRQFAHVTSHDLREPLRNISSFATLLSRKYAELLDKEGGEYLGFITTGVRKMDRLLNDLLTYSVVGVFDHEYSQVDIGRTIADIMRRLQQNKATQGARIALKDLPVIKANSQQMDQLFTQLIDNAIKFRDPARKPEIVIRSEARDQGYVFSVSDNGIGMDKAYKDKIFALFLRLHNQQSAYEGSGIGLSIVKKIVEQHEGKIWIESEVGKGTTVFFFLPKDPPKDATPDHVRDRWQWLQEDTQPDQRKTGEIVASVSDE
ncbi:MAG: ATP-binding protein [Bacteroidota bacterium]